MGRYFYRNAIENALKNNQKRSVDVIIDYVVKYQNFVTSSYLFYNVMTELIDKGVTIKRILDSKIFNFQFDLDEWPSTHYNNTECFRPFNHNIFTIRNHYKTVFPENEFAIIE